MHTNQKKCKIEQLLTVYDKLVTKVNNIETSGFVLKTNQIINLLILVGLLKTDSNPKIREIQIQIPSISALATKSAFTAVENKIPDISSLVKKTDYSANVNEVEKKVTDHNHDKYITTSEFTD